MMIFDDILCVVIKKYLFLLSVKSRIDKKLLSIKSKIRI